MYTIEDFQRLNFLDKMVITKHSRERFVERDILIEDVCNVIATGEIIKQYPDDHPFPSCLIYGHSRGKVIHIVASIDNNYIYIITGYIPSLDRWKNDLKTRK